MQLEYWQKQIKDSPLFPDILWSKPESRQGAGKLLIAGGNSISFAAVGEAFTSAVSAGAGVVHALLPDSLRKSVGVILENCEYAPSSPNGGFGRDALNELLIQSHWADMVLIAGDLGRNSETAMLLEQFVQKYSGPLVITKDAVDYFSETPRLIFERPKTTIVLTLAQLQKLGTSLKHPTPFLLSMGLVLLVQALHDFTDEYAATIVTKELDSIVVADQGRVSSTKVTEDKDIWRVQTAASGAVFWMQNQKKPFEAITSSLI